MGIAGVKDTLAAAYDLHLRYGSTTNTTILVFTVAILVLFAGVTLTHVEQLVPEVEAVNQQT